MIIAQIIARSKIPKKNSARCLKIFPHIGISATVSELTRDSHSSSFHHHLTCIIIMATLEPLRRKPTTCRLIYTCRDNVIFILPWKKVQSRIYYMPIRAEDRTVFSFEPDPSMRNKPKCLTRYNSIISRIFRPGPSSFRPSPCHPAHCLYKMSNLGPLELWPQSTRYLVFPFLPFNSQLTSAQLK